MMKNLPSPVSDIPGGGLLRVRQILTLIPIGRSTWWAGVKTGKFPKPAMKLGPRLTVWRAEDIQKLIRGNDEH